MIETYHNLIRATYRVRRIANLTHVKRRDKQSVLNVSLDLGPVGNAPGGAGNQRSATCSPGDTP